MKRIVLQITLGIADPLMLFGFGGPALIFGATGPGPFRNRWLTEGRTATLFLDADLRFFGAMLIGIGFVFFWTIMKVEAEVVGAVIYWGLPVLDDLQTKMAFKTGGSMVG